MQQPSSKRGKPVFVDDNGYVYNYCKEGAAAEGGEKKFIFLCDRFWKADKCLARVHVVNSTVVKEVNQHSHSADVREGERRRIETALRADVGEAENPKQLLGHPILASASEPTLRLRTHHG